MPRASIRRHELLLIDPASWHEVLARAAHSGDAGFAVPDFVMQWAARGWPVIARRYLPGEAHDAIPVALSLPPQPRRSGMTLRVRVEEIQTAIPPVTLATALAHAPAAWRTTMTTLAQVGERSGTRPALYGSLLWQTLTGMTYLTSRSDLDLCWQIGDAQQAVSVVTALARIEQASPMRIDGELLLPDGAAVAWREWMSSGQLGDEQCSDEVLVKTMHAVTSRPRAALFTPAARA